jgi:hypothetical protein
MFWVLHLADDLRLASACQAALHLASTLIWTRR